ncbi:type II toxin-antitoxin system HicA family toxin [Candidatus Poribacteria bacterium]|nr:type II toxin-antitoxin system HicA family toxin [Candidatus Poribacteria bacterium]
MNKRHRITLNAIFAQPISGNIKWRDVETLLQSLGAVISERAGSRVAVLLNDRVAVFHRPHPGPNMDKGAVRDLRRFLESAGIMP